MVSVVETIEKPELSNRINIDATVNILKQFEHIIQILKSHICFFCSYLWSSPDLPKSVEQSKPFPLSPYAIQKYAGEQYAKIYNHLYQIPCTCLRFFNIYGPRQNPTSDYSESFLL